MQHGPPPELMRPQWFFPFFVLMWVAVTGLLALLGGWSSLAGEFREAAKQSGERFRFVSGSLGARFIPVSYGGCLFVTVNERGFGLSILFPFRLFSPPLFIPWRNVESVEPRRFLFFFRYTVIRIRDHWPTLSIHGAAGNSLQQVFARARGFNVP